MHTQNQNSQQWRAQRKNTGRHSQIVLATAQHQAQKVEQGGAPPYAQQHSTIVCATAQEAQLKEQEVRARLSGLLRKKPKTGFLHAASAEATLIVQITNGCCIETWTVVAHAGTIATSPKQGLRSVLLAGTPVFLRLQALLRRSGTSHTFLNLDHKPPVHGRNKFAC